MLMQTSNRKDTAELAGYPKGKFSATITLANHMVEMVDRVAHVAINFPAGC